MRVLVECGHCFKLRDFLRGLSSNRSENSIRKMYARLSTKGAYKRVVLDKDEVIVPECKCIQILTAQPPS